MQRNLFRAFPLGLAAAFFRGGLFDHGRLVQPEGLVEEADGELAHAQRLGYVLDLIGVRRLADPLAQWLDARRPSVVRLNPAEPERGAPRDRRWRLIVNDTVEPDR